MARSPIATPAHRRALGIALALFAVIFVARLASPGPESGLTFLYVIPVIIIGFEFGALAGVAAGIAAMILYVIGTEIGEVETNTLGYVTRTLMFIAIGTVAGEGSRRLRKALAGAEARGRHFELARDLLGTTSLDGRLLEANGAWERALGWKPEELIGKPVFDLVHPDDLDRTFSEAKRATRGEPTVGFINRLRTRDGDWSTFEWSSRLDQDAGVSYFSARDISERVAEEHARKVAEERFRRVFEDSPTGMAVVGVGTDHPNQILEVNESITELLATPREQLIGTDSLARFAHPDDRAELAEEMPKALNEPEGVYRSELRIVRGDGETRWIHLTTSAVRDADGENVYRFSQLVDIDDYKRSALELEREREFQHALLESLNSAVLACDEDGRTTFLNRAAREWRFAHETLESWAEDHIRRPDGSSLPADETPVARALQGEVVRQQEVGLLMKSGVRTLLVNGQPIVTRSGKTLGAVVAGDDITERKLAEEQLRHLADHDPLSGVYNRRRFQQELERELAHNANAPGRAVVLLLDVDGFKQINDTLGHATGDAVIARLGDALDRRLRTSDVVARLGGDEFAVILRRTTLEEAHGVADQLRDLICDDLREIVPEPVGPVAISVGMASLEHTSTLDADAVLRRADRAMYGAKRAGGARVAIG